MKRKVCTGAAAWLVLITLSHMHMNVGWSNVQQKIQVMLGIQRAELVVGFLPVT